MAPPPNRSDPAAGDTPPRAWGAAVWSFVRFALLTGGAAAIVSGEPDAGGALLVPAGAATLLAASARGTPGSLGRFLRGLGDRLGDAAALAAVAWSFRLTEIRVSAAAVTALTLLVLGSYARVRAESLGFPGEEPGADAVEVAMELVFGPLLGLALLWERAEVAVWLLAAAGAIVTWRRSVAVIRAGEPA